MNTKNMFRNKSPALRSGFIELGPTVYLIYIFNSGKNNIFMYLLVPAANPVFNQNQVADFIKPLVH